jgi:hypothetical protein
MLIAGTVDMEQTLEALAAPGAHSEADFQQALAWELNSVIQRCESAWRPGLNRVYT